MSVSLTRKKDRGHTERERLDALLDSQLAGTLSTVVDGKPWVVPMLFARDGDRILLHGSTGAGALRHVAAGAPACFSVVVVDGLVVAESTFESSANYRSAVVYGDLTPITGRAAWDALDVLSEALLPGRTSEVRPMTDKELAATLALELPIRDGAWMVKERIGGAGDPEEGQTAWAGVVPLRVVADQPISEPWAQRRPIPESVRRFVADHS